LLTTIFGVLERLTTPTRLTEGLAWVTTGLNVGAGLAAPVVGLLADAAGARVALAIPLGSSLVAGTLALATTRHLRRTLPE
jgi:MFS family permease